MQEQVSFRKIRYVFAVILLAGLGGCQTAGRDVELPDNTGPGPDENKPSPCVCNQLDYNGGGYTWRS